MERSLKKNHRITEEQKGGTDSWWERNKADTVPGNASLSVHEWLEGKTNSQKLNGKWRTY